MLEGSCVRMTNYLPKTVFKIKGAKQGRKASAGDRTTLLENLTRMN